MAEMLSYGAVSGHVGVGSMTIGWIAVVIIALVGSSVMSWIWMSIALFRRLTEDQDY